MSKYETIGKQWASSGAGAKKAAEEKKILSIIEKEAKLKEDRDDARIKRDKDKLLQDKVMMMKLNAQLISEKNTRERLARQQEKEWAEALKKKNEDEMAMEKMNDTKRGKETASYKKMLIEQMRQKKVLEEQLETDLAVTKTERDMNNKFFEKLHHDKDLISKIVTKYKNPIQPAPESSRWAMSQRDGHSVAGLLTHEEVDRKGRAKGSRGSPNKKMGKNRRIVGRFKGRTYGA